MAHSASSRFEWRAATGRWRWLMLGTLGVAATSCWGEVGEEEPAGERRLGSGEAQPGNSTATTTTSTSSSPARAPGSECANPTALGGGWERCDNGLIHRAERSGECAANVPRAGRISEETLRVLYPEWDPAAAERPEHAPCIRDSDCNARPLGHCEVSTGQLVGTYCNYGCQTDADCGEGLVCLCDEPVGRCMSSQCGTDADCAEGMCASYVASPGCPYDAFACQTAQDECVTSADCGGLTCTFNEFADHGSQRRYCSPPTVLCGRPFLIQGDARRAASTERDDWYPAAARGAGSATAELEPELRAQVGQGWLEQGLMEHASVAAFARFSLQLLSLGAPAELLNEAALAMSDEIAHARECFALARRHGSGDVGPAPLPLAGALEELDLTAIVLGTIAEGCIGETVAALEAAEAHAHCQDEAARAVLAHISEDETRHAQLAWRFVAWALERGTPSLRAAVREAFERELSAVPASSSISITLGPIEHQLLRQGLVGPELRRALRVRVLHDVVAPCARELLAAGGEARGGAEPWLAQARV